MLQWRFFGMFPSRFPSILMSTFPNLMIPSFQTSDEAQVREEGSKRSKSTFPMELFSILFSTSSSLLPLDTGATFVRNHLPQLVSEVHQSLQLHTDFSSYHGVFCSIEIITARRSGSSASPSLLQPRHRYYRFSLLQLVSQPHKP